MNLSAAMIVKNEAAVLERCLNSLNWFKEIVVVDTGSTDDTVAIAKKCGATVVETQWEDDFSKARNLAIEHVTNPWIMSIDADHVLETDHLTALLVAIERGEEGNHEVGYVDLKHRESGSTHSGAWFFRNKPDIRWTGRIHEVLTKIATYRTGLRQVYDKSPAHTLDPDRNLRILLASDQSDRRVQFYLGREYAERNQHALAIEYMQKYLAQSFWLPEICEAHLTIAKAYWKLGQGDAARAACLEAVRNNPAFKEALLFMADLYYEPWKSKWTRLAAAADNEGVLFIRNP